TTVMLAPEQIHERIERSQARWVVTNPDNTEKFDAVQVAFSVNTTGLSQLPDDSVHPQYHYTAADDAPVEVQPAEPTLRSETALIYFTSSTTARSKLLAHSHGSYRAGHLSTLY